MNCLKRLTWQFIAHFQVKSVMKVEIFLRDICIYEYKFIHSHVETFNLNINYNEKSI